MTTDAFISMTQRVIAKDGFEDYLPTLVLPARRHIMALEGVPAGVDIETASRKWADHAVRADEDYFLAFKVDADHFKVISRVGGKPEERHVAVSAP
jgi:hypothetical protein